MEHSMRYFLFLLLIMPLNSNAIPYDMSTCEVSYFGIQGSQDNNKALQCFIDQKEYLYAAIMYANGEGTEINYNLSKVYFEKAISDHYNSLDLEEEAFKSELDKRINFSAKKYKKIDFCKEIARDTFTMNKCAYIDGELADLLDIKQYDLIKYNMTKDSKNEFDKLVNLFQLFRKKDSIRVYQVYIDGSIRDLAYSGQESYLTENFNNLVNSIIKKRSIDHTDLSDFKSSDVLLNTIYSDKLKEYKTVHDSKDLIKATKEAQRAWISYREQWVSLCSTLNFKELKKDVLDTSIKTILTTLRNKELQYDPIGSE